MSILDQSTDGSVRTLTLARPDSLNALSSDLRLELMDAIEAAVDDDVRCLVVTGAGKAFSAGGDIDQMRERHETGDTTAAEYQAYMRETAQVLVERLHALPIPTIAKVSGPAVGAGLGLALACDLLVADTTAKFGAAFRNVGLGPDAGASFLLPRLVGPQVALEMIYTGEVVDADRAVDIGLVNRVVAPDELDETVTDLAQHIASGPTRALTEAKRLVHDNHERDLSAALEAEAGTQSLLYTTADHEEGVSAFLERRDPTFEGH